MHIYTQCINPHNMYVHAHNVLVTFGGPCRPRFPARGRGSPRGSPCGCTGKWLPWRQRVRGNNHWQQYSTNNNDNKHDNKNMCVHVYIYIYNTHTHTYVHIISEVQPAERSKAKQSTANDMILVNYYSVCLLQHNKSLLLLVQHGKQPLRCERRV